MSESYHTTIPGSRGFDQRALKDTQHGHSANGMQATERRNHTRFVLSGHSLICIENKYLYELRLRVLSSFRF